MLKIVKRNAFRVADALERRLRAYSGHWSTPHPDLLSGLAAIDFSIRSNRGKMPPVHLVVQIAEHQKKFALKWDGNRATAQVAIHTHLLLNGRNRLTARVESEDAEVLWSARVPLNVVNDSALAARVRESLRKSNVPIFVEAVIDSADYDFADASLIPWFDRPDADAHIYQLQEGRKIDSHEAAALRQFVSDGYLVLEGLIDDDLISAVNEEIDQAVAKQHDGYVYGTGQRIERLHQFYPNVRKLWLDPRYLRFIDLIFGQTARPCQTLNYLFGSQQSPHQDSAFLTPFPAGYMCGTWIALQDINAESGELEIYPGSHRTPRPRMAALQYTKVDKRTNRNAMSREGSARLEQFWASHVEAYGPRKIVYRPKRGTVLIWHENLIHGGGKRLDERLTRRSMVIHSFADGAIAFFDHSGYVGYTAPKEFRSSPSGMRVSETAP